MITPTTPSVAPVSGASVVDLRGSRSSATTDTPQTQTQTSPPSQGQASQTPAASPAPAPAEPTPASLKLVVARAAASLAYTYTLVDQVTGRVVAEIPHQAAQDAAARPDYTAGGVLDTTA